MTKMKIRKTLLVSASLIFLFIFTTTSTAFTTYTVEYPSNVKLGDLFTINLVFDYELDSDCLYSEAVSFHWSVNNDYVSLIRKISRNVDNYPRPVNISWTLDTSVMEYGTLEVGDIIRIRFTFRIGTEVNGIIYPSNLITTTIYKITIDEAVTEKTSAGIITSIFVLAAIVIFTRKRKVDPYA